MSAAETQSPSGRRGPTVRAILAIVLAAEIALAAGMVWLDLSALGLSPRDATPAGPVAPGDQRRPWTPADAPAPPPGMAGFPDGPSLVFGEGRTEGFGRVLRVSGRIGPGDAARFRAELDAAPESAPWEAVTLHSPGGVLPEALEIGRAVREAGLATLVEPGAACVSACPTILFGGTERLVSRRGFVGMHQAAFLDVAPITTRGAVAAVQHIQGEIIAFAREAGVDPGVHAFALRTPPSEVYYLVPEELEEYRVATRLTE